jgi:hypothetical protein
MSSDTLQSEIASIRSGDKEIGKLLLAEVIRNDPRNETAWLWMSSVIDTDEQRRYCLERVLQINPHNETARQGSVAKSTRNEVQRAPGAALGPPDGASLFLPIGGRQAPLLEVQYGESDCTLGPKKYNSVVVKVLLNNPTAHNSNHGGTEITEIPIKTSVFSVSPW